jgi:hypothetical protein
MIFTSLPVWFIFLCLILAASYAFGLYYRERKSELPALLRAGLGVLRFLAVFAISFLLLSPFVRTIERQQEKPIVVIAQDNSGSVVFNKDSAFYRQEYLMQLDDMSKSLEADYNVKKFIFGESAILLEPGKTFRQQTDFDQKLSNISDLFSRISALYSKRNLGAVVISTDGIYNAGLNPVYQVPEIGYPIYTIALGDTSRRRDLILSHMAYNRLVYLENKFPLQVTVNAHGCEGSKTILRVVEKEKTIFSRELNIDKEEFTSTINIVLQAEESGLKRYRVSLSPAGEELSLDNNSKDVYIEVLDARNKMLILYHSPHPDIAALKQAAEANVNYEVESFRADGFSGNLEAYNLVVFHQLPAMNNPSTRLMNAAKEKEIPALFILGTQTDLGRVNQWEGGMKIVNPSGLYEEALPVLNNSFGLFTLNDETKRLFNSFPPLTVPSGNYQQGSMANAILYQRIGSVETSRPMILLEQNLQHRFGWITGEGLWRWRIMNYVLAGNHDAFNTFFLKIFQYLSIKEQKRNIRIYHKNSFPEYENLIFDAEVYNQSYELINDPELEIQIYDEEGRLYPYTFSRTADAYRLDAGRFTPGNYSYNALATIGGEVFKTSGQFSVVDVDLESLQLVADHDLLQALSGQSGGEMLTPEQLGRLTNLLKDSSDIKTVIYTSKRIMELINIPWLLVTILTLLSFEWFMRKRSGSY